MSGALIRGGVGSEIALRDILPSNLRSALRDRTEPIARQYEAENPGAVVVCDWELFDDADIAHMAPPQKQQALRDRGALAARREAAAKVDRAPESNVGGDPDRTREILRRAYVNMSRLEVTHPDYERMFNDLVKQIHGLEAASGIPLTQFKIGTKPHVSDGPIPESRRKELSAKVQRYRALPINNRRKSVEEAEDPFFMQLILDVETEPTIREQIVAKITQLGPAIA